MNIQRNVKLNTRFKWAVSRSIKTINYSERFLKQRVEQTLMTKGFPFPIISIAMEEIVYEKDDEEKWQTLVVEGERAQRRYRKYTGYDYERRMKQALFGKGFSRN